MLKTKYASILTKKKKTGVYKVRVVQNKNNPETPILISCIINQALNLKTLLNIFSKVTQ